MLTRPRKTKVEAAVLTGDLIDVARTFSICSTFRNMLFRVLKCVILPQMCGIVSGQVVFQTTNFTDFMINSRAMKISPALVKKKKIKNLCMEVHFSESFKKFNTNLPVARSARLNCTLLKRDKIEFLESQNY